MGDDMTSFAKRLGDCLTLSTRKTIYEELIEDCHFKNTVGSKLILRLNDTIVYLFVLSLIFYITLIASILINDSRMLVSLLVIQIALAIGLNCLLKKAKSEKAMIGPDDTVQNKLKEILKFGEDIWYEMGNYYVTRYHFELIGSPIKNKYWPVLVTSVSAPLLLKVIKKVDKPFFEWLAVLLIIVIFAFIFTKVAKITKKDRIQYILEQIKTIEESSTNAA